MTDDQSLVPASEMKECPFCAETIKAAAVKCRYCQSDLAVKTTSEKSIEELKSDFTCPKCGSRKVDIRRREFSGGKAAGWGLAADLLFGPAAGLAAGLVAGLDDRNELQYKCLTCGESKLMTHATRNGPQTIRLENGNTLHVSLKKGKRDGPFQITSPDGVIVGRGRLDRGKPEGLAETFHPNGAVHQRTEYRKGKIDGVNEQFGASGELQLRERYRRGIPWGQPEGSLAALRAGQPAVRQEGRQCLRCAAAPASNELMCQPCHAHVSAAATAGNTVSPELQQIRLNLEWAWEQKTTERMGLLFAENAIMAQPDIPGLQFEGLAAIKHAYDQSFASDVRCTVKWVVQEGELAWLRYSIYEGHAAGVPMLGRAVLSGNVLNRMDVYNL